MVTVVVQDAAHLVLTFEGEPLSFLSVPGAMDVGVEVHSLSKGFDMIGWRIGWVCGHPRLVQAFADVKDNCDSGQFIAIQKAAITALDDPEIPINVYDLGLIYKVRLDPDDSVFVTMTLTSPNCPVMVRLPLPFICVASYSGSHMDRCSA